MDKRTTEIMLYLGGIPYAGLLIYLFALFCGNKNSSNLAKNQGLLLMAIGLIPVVGNAISIVGFIYALYNLISLGEEKKLPIIGDIQIFK